MNAQYIVCRYKQGLVQVGCSWTKHSFQRVLKMTYFNNKKSGETATSLNTWEFSGEEENLHKWLIYNSETQQFNYYLNYQDRLF